MKVIDPEEDPEDVGKSLDYLRRKYLGDEYADSFLTIGEKMMNNMMQNFGADKFMNRMFRRAEGVVGT